MTDIKQKIKHIFRNKVSLTESQEIPIDLTEELWDDVKGAWSKGREFGKNPIKNLAKDIKDKAGDRLFNKKRPKPLRVSGTGTINPKPITAPNVSSPPSTVAPATTATPPSTVAPASIPTPVSLPSDTTQSSTTSTPVVGPTATLNPVGIEIQGSEDSNQKERKIIRPLKKLLRGKSKEFVADFNKLKEKNGITSSESTDEIAKLDPTDKIRKAVIKNLFATKFYTDTHVNLFKNLKNYNIISKNKIDSGVFQQAILSSLDQSEKKHARRYSANIKKIPDLNKNQTEIKQGLKKGQDAFKKDMNDVYKSNKDKFTDSILRESFKSHITSYRKFIESDSDVSSTDTEDTSIRTNDYVWWLDEVELKNILSDAKKRSQLTFSKRPIEFEADAKGERTNGTSATIRFLSGPEKGESQKIDIRNLEIPQELAVTLIKFGKVLSNATDVDTEDIDNDIEKNRTIAKDKNTTPSDKKKAEDAITKLKKEKVEKTGTVRVQLFNAKSQEDLDKTIASGKTKITPDPSGVIVDVDSKQLTKLNDKGKEKLLKIIAGTSIVLYSVLTLLSPSSAHTFLTGLADDLNGLAKKFGDIAGSKYETNF